MLVTIDLSYIRTWVKFGANKGTGREDSLSHLLMKLLESGDDIEIVDRHQGAWSRG